MAWDRLIAFVMFAVPVAAQVDRAPPVAWIAAWVTMHRQVIVQPVAVTAAELEIETAA